MSKIANVDFITVPVNHRGSWIFVTITTDDGLTGTGEASHSRDDAAVCELIGQLASYLVGMDARNIQAIVNGLPPGSPAFLHCTAHSAIEQALWDLLGQDLGVPTRVLFGGAIQDTRVPLYANINRAGMSRDPGDFASVAMNAVADGFTAIKLAPFDEVQGDARDFSAGLQRIQAVRTAVGDDIGIAVDCHGRFTAEETPAVTAALEPLRLMWLEEVVPDHDITALKQASDASAMPSASGESLLDVEQYAPFLTEHVVDILMPDVKHVGGMLAMRQVASAARIGAYSISPHNPAGPIATLASAQVMVTCENATLLEYAYGEVDWRAELLQPREDVSDGYLILNQQPGLGHCLNSALITKLKNQQASTT